METEIIDRLFLELSLVTQATTCKELRLRKDLDRLMDAVRPFASLINTTSGHIATSRLSFADWHKLVKAFNAIELDRPPTGE